MPDTRAVLSSHQLSATFIVSVEWLDRDTIGSMSVVVEHFEMMRR